MSLWCQIKARLYGPASHFHVEDSVQLIHGNYLMVVIRILSNRKMPEPLIECQWYDPESQSVKVDLFPERNLRAFDWHTP